MDSFTQKTVFAEFSQNFVPKNNSTTTLDLTGGGYLDPWTQDVIVWFFFFIGIMLWMLVMYILFKINVLFISIFVMIYHKVRRIYHRRRFIKGGPYYHFDLAVYHEKEYIAWYWNVHDQLYLVRRYLQEPTLQNNLFQRQHFHGESYEEFTIESLRTPLELSEKLLQVCNECNLIFDHIFDPKKRYTKFERYRRVACSLNNLFKEYTGNYLIAQAFKSYTAENKEITFTERIVHDMGTSFLNLYGAEVPEDEQEEADIVFERYSVESKFKAESFMEGLEQFNALSSEYLDLLNSTIGRKFTALMCTLLCVPALNKIGFSPENLGFDESYTKQLYFDFSKMSKITLPGLILEQTTFIMIKLSNMMMISKKQGLEIGLRSLFVGRADWTKFECEYVWLKTNHKNFCRCTEVTKYDGTPDPFTLEGYFNRCQQALDMADKILASIGKDPYMRARIERCKYAILDYQSDCSSELNAAQDRPFPYAVMLTGPPSIGKSSIKDIIFHQLHMSDKSTGRFEIDYKPDLVYTYNSTDDFYSGFSTKHTSILLDDVAQKHPDIIKQTGGDDLNDLIRIINSIPFLPNQAELEKKGKTPMRVRYVVGTTNTPDLSANHVFKCPAAVYRRMIFVACSVKKEYCQNGTTALGGDLFNPNNMDLWDFKIIKYNLNGNSTNEVYWNGEKFTNNRDAVLDVEQLVSFLHADINRHWTQQERAKAATTAVFGSKSCEHGISSLICKRCMKGESDEESDSPFWVAIAMLNFIPIYCLFSIAYIHQWMFPQRFASKPVWSLRWGYKLVAYLPTLRCTKRIKYLQWIPECVRNRTTKHYFTLIYDDMLHNGRSLYDWYMMEFCEDWRYPAAVGFISLLLLMRRLPHFKRYLGQSQEEMPKPTSDELKRRNYWSANQKVGFFPSAGSSVPELTFHKMAILNTTLIQVYTKCGKTCTTNCLLLGGDLAVTVSHFLKGREIDHIVMHRIHQNGDLHSYSFQLAEKDMFISSEDLLYFRSRKILPAKSMFKYLVSDEDPVHINCPGRMHYIDHKNDNAVSYIDFTRITNTIRQDSYTFGGTEYSAETCITGMATKNTFSGMCGAPVIALQGNNKMICGIHTASNGDKITLIRQLTLENVMAARSRLDSTDISGNDRDIPFVANSDIKITPVHPKCPTLEMDGEYIRIGSHNLPRVAPRTQVGNSPFCDEVVKFYKDKGFPEVTHTSPIKCKPKVAVKLSMEKAFENANFDPNEIDFCVEAMVREFLSYMTEDDLARLKPYPMSAAINGVDGIPYIDRLNLKTSGGFGHSGPKRKMFSLSEPTENHEYNYVMTPELQLEYDYYLDCYKNGMIANPIFKCSFKDEPITFKKAEISKVRIFSGSPAAFSIIARKYFLCIIREFVGSKRLCFEMAIGANAHGTDWSEIYHHVVRHGTDRCFAGDYKNFDKQMPPEIILAAFDVILSIFKAAGWHSDDLQVVKGIAYDTAFPTLDLFGTIIKCFGNNPSGHILTTPINSLANSLYMRIACRRILLKNNYKVTLDDTGVNYTKFRDIMSLVTYGDDNCGSTSDKYPCINHTTIQAALAEVGIIYTTDDKEAASKGLVDVSKITFLKRHFVHSQDLGCIVGPLLEESLFKALTVWTFSKSICVKEQSAAVIDSVNREYFFYGYDVFQNRHAFLKSLCIKHELLDFLPDNTLKGWEELKRSIQL